MALVPFPGSRDSDMSPADPDDTRDPEDDLEDGSKMSFLEHLDELRKRLLASVLALVGGFGICLFFSDRLVAFVYQRLTTALPAGGNLIYTEPTEGFMLHMKMAALAGLFLASPMLLWQVWRFIAPGLYAHEKKFAIPFVVFATFFFMSGAVFAHYVAFPWGWKFFASFSNSYIEFTPRVAPVFSLYVKMLLGFGLVFQMPTVVFFLARMGVVSARFLIRNFKYAVLIIFIVAAVLSPGTDVVSQALMAFPMLALYVISIGIAWIFAKRTAL